MHKGLNNGKNLDRPLQLGQPQEVPRRFPLACSAGFRLIAVPFFDADGDSDAQILKLAVAVVVAATLFGGTADAQNWNLNPAFGTLNLRAGFLPDPRTRRIQAGGDSHFNGGGGCPGGGWFANAPDYRVNYSAWDFPLTFYVSAPGDTMLLVNDPAGQWFCNDDYNGLDPADPVRPSAIGAIRRLARHLQPQPGAQLDALYLGILTRG